MRRALGKQTNRVTMYTWAAMSSYIVDGKLSMVEISFDFFEAIQGTR